MSGIILSMELLGVYRKKEKEAHDAATREAKMGNNKGNKKGPGAISKASNPSRFQNLPKKRK